jgi:hypothetical protein
MGKRRNKAYTFSDVVAKYGANLMEENLGEAYKKAGVSFSMQLQQNFLVLHDKEQETMLEADQGPLLA